MSCKCQEAGIVPDVVGECSHSVEITIKYPAGEVKQGNKFTPAEVSDAPSVSWKAEPNDLYTLVLTDPDAPSRSNPVYGEYRHWVMANIPGDDISKGDVLDAYVGSAPPAGTGYHRYVFLLYKQQGKISKNHLGQRHQWKVTKFADVHNLKTPIAINYYLAQH